MTKINLFQDKEYEQLDWLNRAVESFVCPINDKMAAFPESVELTFDDFKEMHLNTTYDISVLDALIQTAPRFNMEFTSGEASQLYNYFELVLPSQEVRVDFETRQVSGQILLVKKKAQLEDEDILFIMTTEAVNRLSRISYEANIGRMNEIMDLLNCTKDRKSRSANYKTSAIKSCVKSILGEDKWRIRNMDLAIKCADWIVSYINDGNLAALSNFTRLKCMTHNNAPIYSMDTI